MTTERYANRYDERDIWPHEVVEYISGTELVVKEMFAKLVKGWVPKMILGLCVNEDEQDWTIKPDTTALEFRIRLDRKGKWKDAEGNVYRLEPEPRRFHHYTFVSGVFDSEADA